MKSNRKPCNGHKLDGTCDDYTCISNILLYAGMVTKSDLKIAAIEHDQSKEPIGQVLIKMKKITQDDLNFALDKQKEMRTNKKSVITVMHQLWEKNMASNKEVMQKKKSLIDTMWAKVELS